MVDPGAPTQRREELEMPERFLGKRKKRDKWNRERKAEQGGMVEVLAESRLPRQEAGRRLVCPANDTIRRLLFLIPRGGQVW
jgi:hypothetical protein